MVHTHLESSRECPVVGGVVARHVGMVVLEGGTGWDHVVVTSKAVRRPLWACPDIALTTPP